MSKFYLTFDNEGSHPYVGGWAEVHADNKGQAAALFRAVHPDVYPGYLNCAFVYSEEEFTKTVMFEKGNYGIKCHEIIGAFKPETIVICETKADKCCMCGAVMTSVHDKHNASPIKNGTCCSQCHSRVILARMLAGGRML